MNFRLLTLLFIFISIVGTVNGQTNVNGNQNGTWTFSNSPYVLNGSVTIPNGDTLEIEPGVEVYFIGQKNIIVKGTLLALGTQADSINFKKVSGSTLNPGGRIEFSNQNSTSRLSFCTVDSLGYYSQFQPSTTGMALEIKTDNVIIDNSTIRNSQFDAIRVRDGFSPTIENCRILQTVGFGVKIYNNAKPFIQNCTFDNNNKSSIISFVNGLSNLNNLGSVDAEIEGGIVDNFSTIPYLGIGAEYLLSSSIEISTNDTLLIEPGVDIYFKGQKNIIVDGTLLALGTQADSISFKKVGDPLLNPGGRIEFTNQNSTSRLSFCTVDSLGYYTQFQPSTTGMALEIKTDNVIIDNSTIRNSQFDGIRVRDGFSPTIENCRISETVGFGVKIYNNAKPFIQNCTFDNNKRSIISFINGLSNLSNLGSVDAEIEGGTVDNFSTIPFLGIGAEYILSISIDISSNDTLLIEPGVDIYFKGQKNIIVDGTLLALGTQADSISFKKVGDPTLNPGGRIEFNNQNSTSKLSFCIVDSLGYYSQFQPAITGMALEIKTDNVIIENSRISNSQQDGIRVRDGYSPIITYNTIRNTTNTGLKLYANTCPTVSNCTFLNNGIDISAINLSSLKNTIDLFNAKIKMSSGNISGSETIPFIGQTSSFDYTNDLEINSNGSLEIEAGANINFIGNTKFINNGNIIINSGANLPAKISWIPN